MYHQVDRIESVELIISSEKLEAQFKFLAENGYHSYHLSELIQLQKLRAKKNIVITFDDGYVNQLKYAYPLLQKYKLKATFFIPLKYIGGEDTWNSPTSSLMDFEALRSLDPTVVELAYHSYEHEKYTELSSGQIETDTQKAFEIVSENALPLKPYLAYPYGKFPRKDPERLQFFQQLQKNNFQYGLRIGNRLNAFPFNNPFEIQRIDIKGEYSLSKFRRKIRFGKLF
jgi:peptidoglycan/xylan/chitin deacetylase (PgdA/CDA1 family)